MSDDEETEVTCEYPGDSAQITDLLPSQSISAEKESAQDLHDIRKEGGPPYENTLEEEDDIFDNILDAVVEQGRFVTKLVTCLSEAATKSCNDPPPQDLLKGTMVEFFQSGFYEFLTEGTNSCDQECELSVEPVLPSPPAIEIKELKMSPEPSKQNITWDEMLNVIQIPPQPMVEIERFIPPTVTKRGAMPYIPEPIHREGWSGVPPPPPPRKCCGGCLIL